MIRQATPQDRDAFVNLARTVYGQFMLDHGVLFVETDAYKTIDFFIANGQNLVIEQDGDIVGITAWIITGHPANQKCKIFQEVLWACNSKYKTDALILLRGLERKAKECGANVVVLANLNIDNEARLKHIYGKMGYVFMESHFCRINGGGE